MTHNEPFSMVVVVGVLGLCALVGSVVRCWRRQPLPPDPWDAEGPVAEGEAPEGPPALACPHCLEPNEHLAAFCVSCGGPLGDTVTLDPLKQIRAQGWTILQVVNHPYRGLVLVGLWALLLPEFFGFALAVAAARQDGQGLGPLLGFLVFAWVPAIILYKATRNYLGHSGAQA